jgi:DSF synthase
MQFQVAEEGTGAAMTYSPNVDIAATPTPEQSVSQHPLPWLGEELTAPGRFGHLEFEIDESLRTLWCYMAVTERPSFSTQVLADLTQAQSLFRAEALAQQASVSSAIRTIVHGSRTAGMYNLGGDLGLFVDCIRRQDRARLTEYAHLCVDIVFNNSEGYGQGVTTVALVQGQAMGGGFEAALSCHVIVAERSARLGLPEVMFNLFPGMGAYSFLSRRLTPAAAERMILSGKVYTAAELYDLGIVDVLAEDGGGVAAVRQHVREMNRRQSTRRAMRHVCNAVNPITRAELIRVTDIWVETALQLTEEDLRRMSRFIDAQDRRAVGQPPMAAE